MEFVDNKTKVGVALAATRLDSWTVSIELPKSLERAMRKAGLVDPRSDNPSLNQWSKESGVHTSTISSFLTGRKSRPANVQKMADALEVSPSDLYSMVGRELSPWSPPSGTEKLNTRQRHALNELILAFTDEDPAEKAGDGDAEATPTSRAGVSPATGKDDGKVRPLRPDLDTMAAYDTGNESDKQRLDREAEERDQGSQDPGDDWA